MSGSVVTAGTNIFPMPDGIIRLQDDVARGQKAPCHIGKLQNVTEQDGCLLACIDNVLVEVPRTLATRLQQLVGRRIGLAIVDGKFRLGALST